MKAYKPSELRVVGFFGHRGSGKTSVVESCLFTAKSTTRLGSVDGDNLALELDEEALARKTTMQANVGHLEWDNCRIGVIDTPGDSNFWGSTLRAMAVVDAGVITVAASDGVETMTARVMNHLAENKKPLAAIVTKLDKDSADLDTAIEEIKMRPAKTQYPLLCPSDWEVSLKASFLFFRAEPLSSRAIPPWKRMRLATWRMK